jgi:hypothetical protein
MLLYSTHAMRSTEALTSVFSISVSTIPESDGHGLWELLELYVEDQAYRWLRKELNESINTRPFFS